VILYVWETKKKLFNAYFPAYDET